MKKSHAEAQKTRRNIVESASRLFRSRGLDGVSIADIMSSLQLTVGGFYRHFPDKEALVAEAIEFSSLETTQNKETSLLVEDEAERAETVLRAYLSNTHRLHPEQGCPVAALGSEVSHSSSLVKTAFTAAIERLLSVVSRTLPVTGGQDEKTKRSTVLYKAATTVGALILARATQDETLAAEILESAVAGILNRAP